MIKQLLVTRAERNRQQAALIVARISRHIELARLVRRAKEKAMFEPLFNAYVPFEYPDIAEYVPSLEPLEPLQFNPVTCWIQATNGLFTSPAPTQGIEFDIGLARDAFQAGLQMQDVLQPLWD